MWQIMSRVISHVTFMAQVIGSRKVCYFNAKGPFSADSKEHVNTSHTCITFNSLLTICIITDRCPFINIIHRCEREGQSVAFFISPLDDSCAQLGLLKQFLYIKDFLTETIKMLVSCRWECKIWSCTSKICSAFCPHRAFLAKLYLFIQYA